MRRSVTMLIILIAFGASWSFALNAEAVPQDKVAAVPKVPQGQREITADSTLDKEKKIVLAPFFQPQRKDSRIWIERIIVTLLMAMPKDLPKYDLNNPTFRKMLYDLLLQDEPDAAIKSKVTASLSKQIGMPIDATIQISRSTIIVR
jgi:hypothetical protein